MVRIVDWPTYFNDVTGKEKVTLERVVFECRSLPTYYSSPCQSKGVEEDSKSPDIKLANDIITGRIAPLSKEQIADEIVQRIRALANEPGSEVELFEELLKISK